MRATIPGLASPHPIGHTLPALYLDDEFTQRFTAGLDEVIAPVFAVLDNLPAYLDPMTAPIDFVDYLADWVGAVRPDGMDESHWRAMVAESAALYRGRGTVTGIADQLRYTTGYDLEIEDSGGTAWSARSGGGIPGSPTPSLEVHIHAADPATVDVRRVESLVAELVPAHVAARVIVSEVQ